jgi:hypothetical protein
MRQPRIGLWVTLAALPVLAQVASAQSRRGVVQGEVVSSASGLPVPGALVLVEDGGRALADGDGVFLIEAIDAGVHRIAGVAPGCHVGLGEVDILDGELVRVRLALPLPAEAEGLLSRWQEGRTRGEATRSLGTLEIRRRRLQSVEEAIRVLAPDMVRSASGQSGARASLQGRRSATVEGPRDPLVVIDGVRTVHRPEEALASLSIDEVERIDVSTGSAAGWRYGTQGVNGVVEITTRGGVANALALGPRPDACGFTFPPDGGAGGARPGP